MCASCDAVQARREASAALLSACEQGFGWVGNLRHVFRVDPDIPPHLRDFLNKL